MALREQCEVCASVETAYPILPLGAAEAFHLGSDVELHQDGGKPHHKHWPRSSLFTPG
jgi:hypothetical protein